MALVCLGILLSREACRPAALAWSWHGPPLEPGWSSSMVNEAAPHQAHPILQRSCLQHRSHLPLAYQSLMPSSPFLEWHRALFPQTSIQPVCPGTSHVTILLFISCSVQTRPHAVRTATFAVSSFMLDDASMCQLSMHLGPVTALSCHASLMHHCLIRVDYV